MSERLFRGGAITLMLKMVNLGLMFLVSILLARFLGAEEYGAYVFVFALVGLLSEPVFLALRTIAVRNGAVYIKQQEFGMLLGLIKTLHRSMACAALFAAVVLILVGIWYSAGAVDSDWLLYGVGALLPFVLGANRIRDGILRGLGSVSASQLPKLVVRPLSLLVFLCIASLVLGEHFDARWAMAMQLMAALTAGLIYFALMRRHFGARFTGVEPVYKAGEYLRGSISLVSTGLLQVMDERVGILLVGALLAAADTGVYHAAFRLAELIMLAHASANVVFESRISRLTQDGRLEELQRKVTTVARVVFAVSLPVAAAMIVGGEWLLSWWGPEFTEAAPVLAILALAQILSASFGNPIMLLNMTHRSRITASGLLLGLLTNLGLCLWLIPQHGIEGAAWAALASIVVSKFYLVIRLHRAAGIHCSILGGRLFKMAG